VRYVFGGDLTLGEQLPFIVIPAKAGTHLPGGGMSKTYYVYILTNRKNGALYIGVTGDLIARIWQHREGLVEGFTKRYGIGRLVHIEPFDDVRLAIAREKAMKKWRRAWKIELLERDNPDWDDLYLKLNH